MGAREAQEKTLQKFETWFAKEAAALEITPTVRESEILHTPTFKEAMSRGNVTDALVVFDYDHRGMKGSFYQPMTGTNLNAGLHLASLSGGPGVPVALTNGGKTWETSGDEGVAEQLKKHTELKRLALPNVWPMGGSYKMFYPWNVQSRPYRGATQLLMRPRKGGVLNMKVGLGLFLDLTRIWASLPSEPRTEPDEEFLHAPPCRWLVQGEPNRGAA